MSDKPTQLKGWIDHHGIVVWRIANGPSLTVLPWPGGCWRARVLGNMINGNFASPEEAKAAAEKEARALVRQMVESLGPETVPV
jgi:hypothetical protein